MSADLRIGRPRTPAERTLAHARENPEAAEHYARNIHRAETGGEWTELGDAERAEWTRKAIAGLKEHVENTSDWPRPDPPGGGERRRRIA